MHQHLGQSTVTVTAAATTTPVAVPLTATVTVPVAVPAITSVPAHRAVAVTALIAAWLLTDCHCRCYSCSTVSSVLSVSHSYHMVTKGANMPLEGQGASVALKLESWRPKPPDHDTASSASPPSLMTLPHQHLRPVHTEHPIPWLTLAPCITVCSAH